ARWIRRLMQRLWPETQSSIARTRGGGGAPRPFPNVPAPFSKSSRAAFGDPKNDESTQLVGNQRCLAFREMTWDRGSRIESGYWFAIFFSGMNCDCRLAPLF